MDGRVCGWGGQRHPGGGRAKNRMTLDGEEGLEKDTCFPRPRPGVPGRDNHTRQEMRNIILCEW